MNIDPRTGEILGTSDTEQGVCSFSSFVREQHLLPEVPAFPCDVLPETVRALVEEGSQALCVPPEFIATPLLVFAGAALGGNYEISLKPGYTQRPILFAGVVAEPGSAKSPALDLARHPLDVLQAEAYAQYQEAYAEWEKSGGDEYELNGQTYKIPRPAKPQLEHLYTTDATTEGLTRILRSTAGVALVQDELAGWVASFNAYRSGRGADRQSWLSAWSGAPIKVDRKSQEPVFLKRPTVCVTGGIQPNVLPLLMAEAGQRDGFIERILWTWPDAEPSGWTESTVSDDTKQCVVELFRFLRTTPELPPAVVHLSTEAKATFVAWFTSNNEEVRATRAPLQRGAYAKLPNQAARLALVLHCLAHPTDPAAIAVSPETMFGAITLVEYYRRHALRVFSRFGLESRLTPLAARLDRILTDAGGEWLSRRDIHTALARNTTAAALSQALSELEASGRAETRTFQPPAGGRPAEQWRAKLQRRTNELNEQTPSTVWGEGAN